VLDRFLPLPHYERGGVEFKLLATINQHESGVNQIIKLSDKTMVTISDDCSMKLWRTASTGAIGDKACDDDIKIDVQVSTETTTCVCSTGPKNDTIVTGCHSGNIHIHKALHINDSKSIQNAHQNLIRVLISLDSLDNRYFVSADVCGTIKVWPYNI